MCLCVCVCLLLLLVGEAVVGLMFWLYPDWVVLQLIVSVPPLIFIGYYWIVPESVRWLLARKDYATARNIIRKAAHVNGVELSEQMLQAFELNSPTHSAHVRNALLQQQQQHLRIEIYLMIKFIVLVVLLHTPIGS